MRRMWLFLIVAAGCATAPEAAPPGRPSPPGPPPRPEMTLDEDVARAVAGAVARAVAGDLKGALRTAAAPVLEKRLPRSLVISAFGSKPVLRVVQRGATYAEALRRLLPSLPRREKVWPIRVEQVTGVFRLEDPMACAVNMRPGLDMLLAEHRKTGATVYVFSDQLLSRYLSSPAFMGALLAQLYPGCWFHRIRTQASFLVFSDGRVERLFRLRRAEVPSDAAALRAALAAALDYLLRNRRPDGLFGYLYDAARDRFEKKESLIRQAGTTFSVLRISALLGRRAPAAAAEALSALLSHCKKDGDRMYLSEHDGKVTLGASALLLWALGEYRLRTGDDRFDAQAAALAGFLLSMRKEDGSFHTHFDALSGPYTRPNVWYYPGETCLALASAAKVWGRNDWKEASLKAWRALAAARVGVWKSGARRVDAWMMKAADALGEALDDDELAPVWAYADHLCECQKRLLDSMYPDYRGAFALYGGQPKGPADAAAAEGLAAAWRIARRRGAAERARKYGDALVRLAPFLLRHQFDEVSAHWLPGPDRALGGVTTGLTDGKIRIDGVQHTMEALAGALAVLEARDGERRR